MLLSSSIAASHQKRDTPHQGRLKQKLKKCKDALIVWSKKKFGNNLERVAELKSNSRAIQEQPFSDTNLGQEKRIKEELENPQIQEDVSTWRAPDHGKFKANCDVAISNSGHSSKTSVVFRNWKGKLLEGRATSIQADSNLDGELQAIRVACEMAKGMGLKEVEIESDNKQAISLNVSELVPPWNVSAVVMDIRHFAKEGNFLFRWVKRTANMVAHEVASLALSRVALLAGGDVLALLIFSAIGTFSHGFCVFDTETLCTADPFIVDERDNEILYRKKTE
ncbi:hypothetical protein Vadar_004635 [Vaccinium darrowii]|uniref:Uncharacterized protein n=1 Tax=Vaccinium darrowii TaxID=229202 RepID=A0ACB7Z9X6_9ERIC|nr:hypothetical protein Vadar_004635 [Vaccinium darrowii]